MCYNKVRKRGVNLRYNRRQDMKKKIKRWLYSAMLAITVIWCGKSILCSQNNVAAVENENNAIQGTYGDNLKWSFKDGVFTVSGTGEIPVYFSRKLQNQGNEFYCDRVKEIVIEKGIDQIGRSAFEGCGWTKKVVLPEGIKVIGDEAFSTIYRLAEINLPDGLETIGDKAFYYNALKKVQIPESVSTIGKGAFSRNAALEEINIPRQITKLNDEVLSGCRSLKKIDLPNNLESIGNGAFSGCENLQEIKIPQKVSAIGTAAFSYCQGIKDIRWPNKIKTINNSMFKGCEHLENIYMPEDLEAIGDAVFKDCVNIEEMKVPQTVKTIGGYAFAGCTKLQNIELPDRLKVLESYIFNGCTSLEEFQFSKAVQNIKEDAFKDCTKLKYLVIPDSVTQIGEEAFQGCKGLEYIKLSRNIEVLRDQTFMNCESLTSIEIPSGVLTLEDKVISRCEKLKMIILPESVVSIQQYSIGWDMKEVPIIGASGSEAERYAQDHQRVFKSYNAWNCDHNYDESILKNATTKKDGAEAKHCKKCGYTILQNLSRPVSVTPKKAVLSYNGARNFPRVEIKLANGKILDDKYYHCLDEEDHINPGTYHMKVQLKNGYEGTLECTYQIVKADCDIWYNGKDEIIGSYDKAIPLKITTNKRNAKMIYKVSDPKNLTIDAKGILRAKNIGRYTVTVYVPEDKNYKKSKEIKVKVRIIPAKVKLRSAKAGSRRKINIKWIRDTKVQGYHISYSTNKNMLNSKTITIKKNKTTSAVLKNLKSKKKYYIEIYSYKKEKAGKRYTDVIGPVTKKTIRTK